MIVSWLLGFTQFNINQAEAATGTTYYVDCTAGLDTNSGTSPTTAWKSTAQANKVTLLPGQSLLLKRGCVWTTRLDVAYSGTSTAPIRIGAYGTGNLPTILNGVNQGMKISGSYLIIENINVHANWLKTDPNCKGQAYGYYQVGFNFLDGASYDILRLSESSGNTIGVKLAYGAHHNKIANNNLHNNSVLQTLDPTNPKNDLGAWGILINGTDNEIAFNTLQNNNSWCSYGPILQGNSVELYAAQRNKIHHNTAINDITFTELGGRSDRHSEDNTYSYNLYYSTSGHSRFLITSGVQDTDWGPSYRTVMLNNTVYETATDSQGVVCWKGCSTNILTLQNNIIWAQEKAAYADAKFYENNNIYWNSTGTPTVQFTGFTMSTTSKIANPMFNDPANRNFRILSASPAVNKGVTNRWLKDLAGTALPQVTYYDIGAYEYAP